ncbi:MAG: lipoprotein [Nitrospinota bacterium]
MNKRSISILFVALAISSILLSSCGVKGDPIPPEDVKRIERKQ